MMTSADQQRCMCVFTKDSEGLCSLQWQWSLVTLLLFLFRIGPLWYGISGKRFQNRPWGQRCMSSWSQDPPARLQFVHRCWAGILMPNPSLCNMSVFVACITARVVWENLQRCSLIEPGSRYPSLIAPLKQELVFVSLLISSLLWYLLDTVWNRLALNGRFPA